MITEQFKGTIVIADTETTGIDIVKAGVCQVAALSMTQNQDWSWSIEPLFQTYCSPSEPMEPQAMAVHGITPEMYQYAPRDAMALWALSTMLLNLPPPIVLSGYNCTRYDYPLMERLFPAGGYTKISQIDVFTLMLRMRPEKGHKLTEVFADMIGDQGLLNSAHDAMADCFMTALILQNYFKIYPTDPEVLAQWCNTPQPMDIMTFGKYKGKAFEDVPHSYLEWLVKKADDLHPDLALSLRKRGLM